MSNTIMKEDVVNNSNHLHQTKIDSIEKEINGIWEERRKTEKLFSERIEKLDEEKKSLIEDGYPLKFGDKFITKERLNIYRRYQSGKTERSIKFEMVDKDYVKGEIFYVHIDDDVNLMRVNIRYDLEDGFVSQHYLDNNERSYNNFSECKVVSLDEFNKSYELIKN